MQANHVLSANTWTTAMLYEAVRFCQLGCRLDLLVGLPALCGYDLDWRQLRLDEGQHQMAHDALERGW